jgi:hypothetical protein
VVPGMPDTTSTASSIRSFLKPCSRFQPTLYFSDTFGVLLMYSWFLLGAKAYNLVSRDSWLSPKRVSGSLHVSAMVGGSQGDLTENSPGPMFPVCLQEYTYVYHI